MKLKTIVNKVTEGSITSVTLVVHEGDINVLEMDLSIEYATAKIEAFRVIPNGLGKSQQLIKKELEDKGVAKIEYEGASFGVDELDLSLLKNDMDKKEFHDKYMLEINSMIEDLDILKGSHIYEIDKVPGNPRASTVAKRLEKKRAIKTLKRNSI